METETREKGGGKTQQETLDCYKVKPVFTGMHGSWLGIGTSLQSWHDEKVTL